VKKTMTENKMLSNHQVLPETGELNLSIHDLPHDESYLEWWYFNAHFKASNGKSFAFFASFFRFAKDPNVFPFKFIHSLTWSLVDLDENKYFTEITHDPEMLSKITETMEAKENLTSVEKALFEMVKEKKLPAPDYLMNKNPIVEKDRLNLIYDCNSLTKNSKGHYILNLNDQLGNIKIFLTFKPKKKAFRHGKNGKIKGSINEGNMYYYFIPENGVEGSILYQEKSYTIKGNGWYDHEFSDFQYKLGETSLQINKHWMWFAIQFDNNCQLTVYALSDKKTEESERLCVWIDQYGESLTFENNDIIIDILEEHISKKTGVKYPISWRIQITKLELNLHLKVRFTQQEVVTILSTPSFWEGSVQVNGTFRQLPITGNSFAEITTDKNWNNLETLFDQASEEILNVIHQIIPEAHDVEKINMLMTDYDYNYLKSVPSHILHEALIQPLKEMLDRKGKSWRSHLLRLFVGLAGGDPYDYDGFAALLQILHCSSLIIDDVEDQSPMRRGSVSCHEMFGVPFAINSGNFGYFVGERMIRDQKLNDNKKLQVYEAYFNALCLCHGGQALDLRTFKDMLPAAFDSGNSQMLSDCIKDVHTMKTGIPIKMMAHIIAIIEDLDAEKRNALCNYAKTFGLAYQIIDDVRDFDGSFKGSKEEFDDIRERKATLPLVKAIELSTPELRKEMKILWDKPDNSIDEMKIIANWVINSGALTACKNEALDLMDVAWQKLDKLFPDSHYKLMVRAITEYFLAKYKK
jgi:geranylgeranyl pyrophosphate synthase/predicted secreted hydrolase